MIIGVPKEIKNREFRVSLTPSGVAELVSRKHQVLVQKDAGLGSGFSNEQYTHAGATVFEHAADVYAKADLIIKVKEPLASEYALIKEGQIVFTYFHFASSEELTHAMIERKAICIAYETIQKADQSLPILTPMSEVAGRMSIQIAAHYLEKGNGGSGKLMGGVPGVKPARVLILGGGVVGTQAAKMAAGLGAEVILMDINLTRLRYLTDVLPANVTCLYPTKTLIEEYLPHTDVLVGAVLIPGGKAPVLASREMVETMPGGSVVIDVAVDQGGCIETCKPTSHEHPIFLVNDIIHYCVPNIPGAVPVTSTNALTNASLPYLLQLADKGWKDACRQSAEIEKGLSIAAGKVTDAMLAKTFQLSLHNIKDLLN
ncbi:alanine dehydrogenase [Cytophaga hutchinsonii]|uniref:Alanine dehydrogenase n=1 Tax=Cytophaga hutchinsonii (strain ATCC 33406 / DSM 1761 / CIP 103989 / NBRC 15051 / NCIMB 9469 / D465) TaxID=269798 RepID=A0A6N4SSH8_CYTH3|nr:alanine dehydrogenase [Cytophaga hutchinsonii]ABG59261.1 L-alanine dehydrogenase [Cytophaga hutchinsonii ATCC 33406]SFX33136.1 alanine dehydrogenase [Cytophaga hutchinsonii ATCC 33406]